MSEIDNTWEVGMEQRRSGPVKRTAALRNALLPRLPESSRLRQLDPFLDPTP